MADITLSDGREITIDLGKISVRELRALFDPHQPVADEDATACKVTGLSLDEYMDLTALDQKRFWHTFFRKAQEPLSDPN